MAAGFPHDNGGDMTYIRMESAADIRKPGHPDNLAEIGISGNGGEREWTKKH